jgi:hypothetical protein
VVNKHLGVEDAGSRVDNADSLVECLDLVDVTSLAVYNGNQVQSELLWVKIGGEAVRETLLLACGDQSVISSDSQIAHNRHERIGSFWQWLHARQCTRNEGHRHGLSFIIDEVDNGFVRVTIYDLHTENLSCWELCRDRDGDTRWRRRVCNLLFGLR